MKEVTERTWGQWEPGWRRRVRDERRYERKKKKTGRK